MGPGRRPPNPVLNWLGHRQASEWGQHGQKTHVLLAGLQATGRGRGWGGVMSAGCSPITHWQVAVFRPFPALTLGTALCSGHRRSPSGDRVRVTDSEQCRHITCSFRGIFQFCPLSCLGWQGPVETRGRLLGASLRTGLLTKPGKYSVSGSKIN